MGKMLIFGKNAGLFLCGCTLIFALAFSFSPIKMLLLQPIASTVTVMDTAHCITLQGASLPFPTGLSKGRALSFPKGAISVEELLALFGGKVVACEKTEDVTLYHAYARGIGETEALPFGKVNLQIAVGKGYIAVATPVFYGSF